MNAVEILAFVIVGIGAAAQLVTTVTPAIRLRAKPRRLTLPTLPRVSLVRPVRGVENKIEQCIETSFRLDYPNLEVIFCVDEESDPIVPIVRRLIAKHPHVGAKLLVGRDSISNNPKLNNVVKGWNAATANWIIISDSNGILPPDFVETLLVKVRDDVGVVSTSTIATEPLGISAEIEVAYLAYQARWTLTADSFGLSFALGKTLMWRRDLLNSLGGLVVLGREAAEDIASTKALRGTSYRPRLAQHPVAQPLGWRRWKDVWKRQARWAQLRRVGLRLTYWPEPLSGGFFPLLAGAGLAASGTWPVWAFAAYAIAWFGAEAAFTAAARWPLSWMSPIAWIARDVLIEVLWVRGWFGSTFEWRGHAMTLKPPAAPSEPAAKPEPRRDLVNRSP